LVTIVNIFRPSDHRRMTRKSNIVFHETHKENRE